MGRGSSDVLVTVVVGEPELAVIRVELEEAEGHRVQLLFRGQRLLNEGHRDLRAWRKAVGHALGRQHALVHLEQAGHVVPGPRRAHVLRDACGARLRLPN